MFGRILLLLYGGVIFFSCAARKDAFSPEQPTASQTPRRSQGVLTLPVLADSVKFAVIGDSGTGGTGQYQIGKLMKEWHDRVRFEFVLMMGDNLYGSESPKDYVKKFEKAYRPLLEANVKFYAALGNHDNPNQRHYEQFSMGGERYYTFKPPQGGVRFFAIDTNYLDPEQLRWLEGELSRSGSEWKICFFHHPTYSSGKAHGSDLELRQVLEPLFIRYGVNVVFAGHDHFYERIKPQKGIYYFVSGAAGKLRKGGVGKSELTATSFDQDLHFMLVEIIEDRLYFHVFSRTGRTVDTGSIPRQETLMSLEQRFLISQSSGAR